MRVIPQYHLILQLELKLLHPLLVVVVVEVVVVVVVTQGPGHSAKQSMPGFNGVVGSACVVSPLTALRYQFPSAPHRNSTLNTPSTVG